MTINGRLIIVTTLFIKSLPTSLYQREVLSPSLVKSVRLATERGKGRFSDSYGFNFETLINGTANFQIKPLIDGF